MSPASPLVAQHTRLPVRLAGSDDGHQRERSAVSLRNGENRSWADNRRKPGGDEGVRSPRPPSSGCEAGSALYPHGRGGMTGGTYPMSLLDLLYFQALSRRLRLRPRADPLRRAPPRPPTLCRHLLQHRPPIAGLGLPHLFCGRKSLCTPLRRCAVPYCTSPHRIDSPESQLRRPHSLRKMRNPVTLFGGRRSNRLCQCHLRR